MPISIPQFLKRIFRAKDHPERPKKPLPVAKEGDFGTPNNPADKGEEREHFGPQILEDFINRNGVLFVQSSWLEYGRYWKDRAELEIGYQDGHVAFYGRVDVRLAVDFAQAPSKGKWVHAHCKSGYNADRTWQHSRPYRAK